MADLTLPTPNKTPGDGAPADDTNLIIEAINTLNSAVENIPAGPQGPQGEPGTPGADGAAATITVASTVTTEPGADAQVIQGGTAQNATLAFYIPRGAQGPQGEKGDTGSIGPAGADGARGPAGAGVLPGGLTDQILAKKSDNDWDTEWVYPGSSPVTSVDGRQGVVTLNDLYDAAGSASAAQSAAESYADGLAVNYDPAGSASTVAGDLSSHESATTTVHGISDTADLVYTSDSRLSDARTPTAHATSHESGGSDEIEIAPAQVTGTAVITTDSRLSDARTPTAHATSHESGGSDEIEIAPGQVTGTAVITTDSRLSDARTPLAHATSHESGGSDELELAPSQITGTAVITTDSRLSDARTPTAHATSHESGGSDELELAPAQITGTAVVANDVHLVTFCTSSTRPASPTEGQIIYETDTDTYYGYRGSSWLPIGGGATGGGTDDVFYENSQTVTADYTITTNKNALSAGPITVDSGVTVTIPSGSVWTVV